MTQLNTLINKIEKLERISVEETIYLYKNLDVADLIFLADKKKQKLHSTKVFYIENIHIEPTNICINNCKFCAFRAKNNNEGWNLTLTEIEKILETFPATVNEVHITGGINSSKNLNWYIELFKLVKNRFPESQIKALTAIEINYLACLEKKSIEWVLEKLKEAGVVSIAGGGAEILDDNIRSILCPEKGDSSIWIKIHKAAHKIGLKSNATMLYGHIENYEHRIKHLEIIRNIQDETGGFLCFIPLKYRNKNNYLKGIIETNLIEDLKIFAISRLFLDNIKHIKAYWPMFGLEKAMLCLHAGANDIDGTIYNTTKIFSKAGSEVVEPTITTQSLKELLTEEGFIPVKRDTLFNIIK